MFKERLDVGWTWTCYNFLKNLLSGELHIRDTGKSDENSGLEMSNESLLTHEFLFCGWPSTVLKTDFSLIFILRLQLPVSG